MNPAVKIFLYIALTAGLVWFGRAAFQAGADAPAPAGGGTNQPASTNLVTTNAAVTNLVATNAMATNSVAVGTEEVREHRSSERLGRMMTCGFLAFGALVGLGLLVGRDVSAYLASRAENFVYNDNLVGVRDPQYDEAEEAWKRGQHLEAIQLMRDFLKKNPSEQYAALRIAEIYEKDLGNHLAAALEYEEVLKKRLPSERWGWAAIHLANLYSGKLNKAKHRLGAARGGDGPESRVDQPDHAAGQQRPRRRAGRRGQAEPLQHEAARRHLDDEGDEAGRRVVGREEAQQVFAAPEGLDRLDLEEIVEQRGAGRAEQDQRGEIPQVRRLGDDAEAGARGRRRRIGAPGRGAISR